MADDDSTGDEADVEAEADELVEQMAAADVDVPHAFAYRAGRGIPARINSRGLPIRAGHGGTDERYHLIEDEGVAEEILAYDRERDGQDLFRHLSPEQLETALGDVESAVTAIEAGSYDENLDLLLVVERAVYGGRIEVIEAIEKRNRVIIDQMNETGEDIEAIQPGDIVTAG